MTVTAVWPGATAAEMQEQVADRLEKRLQELAYYDRVETTSQPGFVSMLVTVPRYDAAEPRTGSVLPGSQEALRRGREPAERRLRPVLQRRVLRRVLRALRARRRADAAPPAGAAGRAPAPAPAARAGRRRRSTSWASRARGSSSSSPTSAWPRWASRRSRCSRRSRPRTTSCPRGSSRPAVRAPTYASTARSTRSSGSRTCPSPRTAASCASRTSPR